MGEKDKDYGPAAEGVRAQGASGSATGASRSWDEFPVPAPAARQQVIREAAITRAARAIYHERLRQQAARTGVEMSTESWNAYRYAMPVFAGDILMQAEAALRAVGFR